MAQQPDEHEVLRLAQGTLRGDHASAWTSFEAAWPLLERFILRRLARKALPAALQADTGQNVFVRLWRSRLRYRGKSEGEFWAWLRTICDNEYRRAIGRLVRERRNFPRSKDFDSEQPIDPAPGPVELASDDDRFSAVRECLRRLAPQAREVIELLFLPPALTERAVAELLNISPTSVHSQKVAALARLGDCLDSHGIHE